jgi:hypothetical protein
MRTGWPYDMGTFEICGRPGELLTDQAAVRWHPPLEAPAAPVNGPTTCAETTARAGLGPATTVSLPPRPQ